jgi:hypothetical protein
MGVIPYRGDSRSLTGGREMTRRENTRFMQNEWPSKPCGDWGLGMMKKSGVFFKKLGVFFKKLGVFFEKSGVFFQELQHIFPQAPVSRFFYAIEAHRHRVETLTADSA